MWLFDGFTEILKIQKFRRLVSYTGFYCFTAVLTYAYTSNTTRAGMSRGDQFYASYPAGTELLTDTTKLYKAALGNVFEEEDWGPIEYNIMAKHFERQGKSPYAYHAHGNRVHKDQKVHCLDVEAKCLLLLFSSVSISIHMLAAIHGTPSLSWTT